MRHLAAPSFWKCYNELPPSIKELADKKFKILKNNHDHPSLHLKKINRYWSIRVGKKYRALAVKVEEDIIWFWIGKHSEYDKLIS